MSQCEFLNLTVRVTPNHFPALVAACAEASERLCRTHSTDADIEDFNRTAAAEYEKARDEIIGFECFANLIYNHAFERRLELDTRADIDRLFIDNYDRERLYMDYIITSDNTRVFLYRSDYETAILEALQLAFDRLDAAIAFEAARQKQLLMFATFNGAAPDLPGFLSERGGRTVKSRYGYSKTTCGRVRTVEPKELFDAMRLISYWQRATSFNEARLEVEGEETVVRRKGTLGAFKSSLSTELKEPMAVRRAIDAHRSDWFQFAIGDTFRKLNAEC